MPKISIHSRFFLLFIINLINSITLILTEEDPKIIIIDFKTKNNLEDEIEDEEIEDYPYVEPDEDGEDRKTDPLPSIPIGNTYNESIFLNSYFYSGIYTELSHTSNTIIHSLLSFDNSKLSLNKCPSEKVTSLKSIKISKNYFPKESSSFKNNTKVSDEFSFISDMGYKNRINKSLDFLYEDDNNDFFCANLGLNIVSKNEETNFVVQLKKKSAFNKYIWSIDYLTNSNGILVFGEEPHVYNKNSYFKSQYRKIYSSFINNDNNKNSWGIKFSEIYINNQNKKINLNNDKVEILIDQGLIIGTESYRKKLEELYFNKLIKDEICVRKIAKLNFGNEEEYYVYYCYQLKFKGPNTEYSTNPKYSFFSFPDLAFYLQDYNKKFILDKHDLFVLKKNKYMYFLVVFKVKESNVWKLGEPFLFKNKILVFDQENKMIGFYNSNLPKINNNEYIDETDEYGNPVKHSVFFYAMLIGGIIILGGVLLVLAYFFGKKFNEQRKKRANELNDDDYDYSANTKGNVDDGNKLIN